MRHLSKFALAVSAVIGIVQCIDRSSRQVALSQGLDVETFDELSVDDTPAGASSHTVHVTPTTDCAKSSLTGVNYGSWSPEAETGTCTLVADVGENVEIVSDNIVLDCAGKAITGASSGFGIALTGRTGVTVKNCIVRNFAQGVRLTTSSGNTFLNNVVENHTQMSFLIQSGSSDNKFSSNFARNTFNPSDANVGYGFRVIGGSNTNNHLKENVASNNRFGFSLEGAGTTGNLLKGNSASNNVEGFRLRNSAGNTLKGNTASENSQRGIFVLADAEGNKLEGNIVSNNSGEGIFLVQGPGINGPRNNIISGNAVRGNPIGVMINHGSNNIVRKNNVGNSLNKGIRLVNGAENNQVIDNIVQRNGVGFDLSKGEFPENRNNQAFGNVFCFSNESDIDASGSVESLGDDNTCDIAVEWNDVGATPGPCSFFCSSVDIKPGERPEQH